MPGPSSSATLALQIREIQALTRQLDDPAVGLPRVVWFFAALAGTGAHLHYVIRQRLLLRLERLQRTQYELLQEQDRSRQN